jgi:hypothetical protein
MSVAFHVVEVLTMRDRRMIGAPNRQGKKTIEVKLLPLGWTADSVSPRRQADVGYPALPATRCAIECCTPATIFSGGIRTNQLSYPNFGSKPACLHSSFAVIRSRLRWPFTRVVLCRLYRSSGWPLRAGGDTRFPPDT